MSEKRIVLRVEGDHCRKPGGSNLHIGALTGPRVSTRQPSTSLGEN
jgi:hypothetical protein